MNDFTKEELEAFTVSIHRLLQLGITKERDEFYRNLGEKVTSMIDNYCEYESNGSKGLTPTTICRKCGIGYEN